MVNISVPLHVRYQTPSRDGSTHAPIWLPPARLFIRCAPSAVFHVELGVAHIGSALHAVAQSWLKGTNASKHASACPSPLLMVSRWARPCSFSVPDPRTHAARTTAENDCNVWFPLAGPRAQDAGVAVSLFTQVPVGQAAHAAFVLPVTVFCVVLCFFITAIELGCFPRAPSAHKRRAEDRDWRSE
eukprot:CAMPEP_0119359646 /NCGR_PEP_ID=MMETSP1334-20130426/7488_1 /TAXON_ID=127549 /ORGANISM="Calcidiscus leptoporus, Strain RCC1130" /LENGTH=185 /DNA_ID=CAMNT_0007374355 /DNA_START=1 /DNA_END=558 /DNA_ORIENTATION=+